MQYIRNVQLSPLLSSTLQWAGNITVSPGDVKLAKIIQSKCPQAILTIYDGNGYYDFDKNSEAGLLPEIFAIGNAKN